VTTIRAMQESDFDWVLAISAENEVETSHLDVLSLRSMAADVFVADIVEPEAGYLLVFDEHAAYKSVNYLWFRERYRRFVYVDRIVISAAARGLGLARAFYQNLFAKARTAGHDLVCCEVNLDPPNPASDAFHARLGFSEVGRATLPNTKTVRYMTRAL
jgi:uncharacterized protein